VSIVAPVDTRSELEKAVPAGSSTTTPSWGAVHAYQTDAPPSSLT
jgi:hypothetical protein